MKPAEFGVIRRWRWMENVFGFRTTINLFAPYRGAGVKVTAIASDFTSVDVELRARGSNRNYVGSHFGGSLYSMADPFYMFILIKNLGPDYIVWDKSASIDFVKPGYGTVKARFEISKERIEEIRAQVDAERKMDVHLDAEVKDSSGQIVAKIHKVVYVRSQKKKARSAGTAAST